MKIFQFGKFDSSVLSEIAEAISKHLLPSLAGSLPIPTHSFNPLREQFHAHDFLKALVPVRESSKALGVTMEDLYVEGLNFVFGLASPTAGVAVVSLKRLNTRFYSNESNEDVFKSRARKEALHEVLHIFGLGHCKEKKCVMCFSNSILDVDIKTEEPCRDCMRKIKAFGL